MVVLICLLRSTRATTGCSVVAQVAYGLVAVSGSSTTHLMPLTSEVAFDASEAGRGADFAAAEPTC
jgi:hypothetical protein